MEAEEEWGVFLILGLALGGLIGFVVGMFFTYLDVVDIGQAICEEEHNLTFHYYQDGKLHCKALPIEEPYDGITVQITPEGS